MIAGWSWMRRCRGTAWKNIPDDFRSHMILGALYAGSHPMLKRRFRWSQAAVRIQPKDAEARNLLGSALAAVGRVPEAIEQYRQAVALRPDFINARFNLAIALVKVGRYDDAIAEYQRILAVYPDDAELKQRLTEAQAAKARQGR